MFFASGAARLAQFGRRRETMPSPSERLGERFSKVEAMLWMIA